MTGTERKVFQKYYPPDFDPAKIPKAKGVRNRQFVQRVMAPCNMQCNTCREYIYKGKKFNMKRETAEGEFYLGLKIFRFYFKCPNCLAEISFKTDLENCDYQMEHGATRLFEAFKLYQAEEKKREAQEEEDAKDPMKMLEKRTKASRAEMEAMGKLEELQEMNRQHEAVSIDNYLQQTEAERQLSLAERISKQEEEDEAELRRMYGREEDGMIRRRIKEEDDEEEKPSSSNLAFLRWESDPRPDLKRELGIPLPGDGGGGGPPGKPPPQKRLADQKGLLSKLVVVKKKKADEVPKVKEEVKEEAEAGASKSISPAPASTAAPPKSNGLLGLGDYGSGSESD